MSEIGKITRVQLNSDDANILVDVSFSPTREQENIPFRSPLSGVWFVPEVGDVVEVTKLKADQYIAHSPIQSPAFSLPQNVNQGDIVIKLNENTVLKFNRQSDGTYDIHLECDGDMRIDAANIFVGEDGNTERVATESHAHDYTWTDAGGSGTTDPPNEGGLANTEVE